MSHSPSVVALYVFNQMHSGLLDEEIYSIYIKKTHHGTSMKKGNGGPVHCSAEK